MYVKWEGVQGEETRGGGGGREGGTGGGGRVKESTFPRTGMRRGGGGFCGKMVPFSYI